MLMRELGIKPGPEMGAVLKSVEQAQAAGTICSESEAIAWAKSQHLGQSR